LTLDMSTETPWKDNTENLREVPRISVEAYAYAWPGNSAAPRIMPRTQVYTWPSMILALEEAWPRIGVMFHA
ncbi:hypothetical protein PIB30_114994, partial [Stylosanthes scabra]|nr:hypothetical protein [Stylosanthes scabra]